MVTAFFELNHGLAAVAALPAFPSGLFEKLCVLIISRAVGLVVPLATAGPANLDPAAATSGMPAPAFAANVLGPDPLTAASRWAIDAVSGGILKEFSVPLPLETSIKHPLNVLEGNVIGSTASRGHFTRISQGLFEDAAEARVAHAMEAFELGRLANGSSVIRTTNTCRKAKGRVRMLKGLISRRNALTDRLGFPDAGVGQKRQESLERR